mgnify:CR=1 FL=1
MNEYLLEAKSKNIQKVSTIQSQLESQITMMKERLQTHESQCEFEDILKVYNIQMVQVEACNEKLAGEIKRLVT